MATCGVNQVRFFPGFPSFGFSTSVKSWSISGLISASIRSQTRWNSALALAMTRVIGGQLGLGPTDAIVLVAIVLRPLQRLEDREHPIIVGLRERLELVIMAAGTSQRDSQESGRGRSDHVVKLIVAVDHRLGRLIVPGTQPHKCGGDLS